MMCVVEFMRSMRRYEDKLGQPTFVEDYEGAS